MSAIMCLLCGYQGDDHEVYSKDCTDRILARARRLEPIFEWARGRHTHLMAFGEEHDKRGCCVLGDLLRDYDAALKPPSVSEGT